MILIYVVITLIILFLILLGIINKKYENFVFCHSTAIQCLQKINQRYNFYVIPKFDMEKSYDNENIFSDILPIDYLIYQLVYIQNQVQKEIQNTTDNQKKLFLYQNEIKTFCQFNKYDTDKLLRNSKKLAATEKRLFSSLIYKPTVEFFISVRLWLTNIQGVRRSYKEKIFNANEINDIIGRLNQKRGSFYFDRDIWQSICRVERGRVTNKIRFLVYRRDNYRCKKCGRTTDDLEIDHIFPISKGGKSTLNNLQTLCRRCNLLKSNKIEFGMSNPQLSYLEKTKICSICGAPMTLRAGKYGDFYGCSNYPKCKFIENL